jgi:16S rRNA (cytosine967-C5)-methyltransferase
LDRVRRRVSLFVGDARHPPFRTDTLDAVLVDAPCSGTGTFPRHPDARWRLTPARLAKAVKQQTRILDSVAPIVRPGGLLVYLTCSLEVDENENRVNDFLASHPEYQREEDDLFIFPTDHDTDGGFGARLRRRR